jgi:hypothetical protein
VGGWSNSSATDHVTLDPDINYCKNLLKIYESKGEKQESGGAKILLCFCFHGDK